MGGASDLVPRIRPVGTNRLAFHQVTCAQGEPKKKTTGGSRKTKIKRISERKDPGNESGGRVSLKTARSHGAQNFPEGSEKYFAPPVETKWILTTRKGANITGFLPWLGWGDEGAGQSLKGKWRRT